MRIRGRFLTLLALLAAASLTGLTSAVHADDAIALTGEIQTTDANAISKGQGAVAGKIAADFESFAGSSENATSLVTGLRSGSAITLTADGEPTATFTPPTRPMGYGNVSTSLALAKAQLAQQGIFSPTPGQLQTALMGGSITTNGTTVDYRGILQMRGDGMGWGQIAQSIGTKLGPIVSGIKAQNQHLAAVPAAATQRPAATTVGTSAARADAHRSTVKNAPSSRGVVTAAGAPSGASSAAHGKGHGKGATATAGGAPASSGQGIVTAAGHGATPVANGVGGGKGAVVTGAGGAAGSAQGGGNGKALGRAK